jgi:integrase
MLQKHYELATLLAPKGRTWLIIWYNLNPKTGKLERIRKSFDINRIKSIPERHEVAANIIQVLNAALKNGYNYFGEVAEAKPAMKLIEAYNLAFDARSIGVGKDSLRGWQSIHRLFAAWIQEKGYAKQPAASFSSAQLQEYVSKLAAEGKSNVTINNHINLLVSIFKRMVKPLNILQANPVDGFQYLTTGESERFESITKDELQRIAAHLRAVAPHFFCYTQFIFYAYVRPAHISTLQRKQIDFEQDLIYIRSTATKGKRKASKQLLQPLKLSLLALGYDKLQPEEYLFSTGMLPGAKRVDSLRTRAQEIWREEVKGVLGIDKSMYALKHTSGQLYISDNENVDASWLQKQMEHSSLAETETYISARKPKKIDEGKVNLPKY